MADQYDEILAAATRGVSKDVGAQPEPTDDIMRAAQGLPSSAPAAQAPSEPSDPILQAAGSTQAQPQEWKPELFTSGVARNWAQMKAIKPSLQAIWEEYNGDQAASQAHAKEAQGVLQEAGDSQYELFKNVHSGVDFANWLTEKMGEQGITALATIGTGGTGAIATNVVARQMLAKGLISQAGYEAMMLAGSAVPTYALSSAMEGAGTSQEQFDVTGSTQPGISTAAGLSKGLLELYAPMSIARGLISPRTVIGQSVPGMIGKTALKEGSTEYAQELIDIYARKLVDPNYTFFGQGATPWYQGEGFLRAAESGATGAAVGAVYGAPFAKIEAAHARAKALGTQQPGATQAVDENFVPQVNPEDQISPEPAGPKLPPGLSMQEIPQYGGKALLVHLYEGAVPVGDEEKESVGRMYFRPYGPPGSGQMQAANLHIDEKYQRKGIMSEVENYVEQKYGVTIQPDETMSDAEMARWRKKAKGNNVLLAKLQNYRQEGGMWYKGINFDDLLAERDAPNFTSTQGPVTKLRGMILPTQGQPQDKLASEAFVRGPRDDVSGIGPISNSERALEAQREAMLDWIDAKVPRYVVSQPDGTFGTQVFTGTELELHEATQLPQSYKTTAGRVKTDSLQPAAISATMADLADPASGRVWVLPNTHPAVKEQLLKTYQWTWDNAIKPFRTAPLVDNNSRAAFETVIKPLYDQMLTSGLRVIPTRGAGFYYNGMLQVHNEDVTPKSRRSKQILWLDPATGIAFQQSVMSTDADVPMPGRVPVSVDLDKLQPGDYTVSNQVNGETRYLFKRGLGIEKMTPGFDYFAARGPEQVELKSVSFGQVAGATGKVYVQGVNPENDLEARDTYRVLNKVMPAFKKILKELRIKEPVPLLISDDPNITGGDDHRSPAMANTSAGFIVFIPKNYKYFPEFASNHEAMVLSGLMHELGHLVTWHYFSQLPVAIQDGLNAAWEKAVLSYRMGDTSATQATMTRENKQEYTYWTTFSEWLAEQFRRWALSNEVPMTHIEKAYKAGAQKMEEFLRKWEAEFSDRQQINLAEPSHYFSAAMEYLRSVGTNPRGSGILSQLTRRITLMAAPMDVQESPAASALMNQVQLAVRSMMHMFPMDVQLQLNEALNPHIVAGELYPASPQAGARWIYNREKNLKIIELAVGALNASAPEAHTRVLIAHELWHAYEDLGLINPQETALIMRDIKNAKLEGRLFPGSDRAQLRRRIQELADRMKLSPDWVERTYAEQVDRELRAYYIQEFADTGIAHSPEGRSIMTRVLEILERIANFIRGLGYQTKEDVLRSFFKGEMLARQDRNQVSSRMAEAALPQEVIEASARHAPDTSVQVGNYAVHTWYEGDPKDKKNVHSAMYDWRDRLGNLRAQLQLENYGPKGFDITWVQAEGGNLGLLTDVFAHAEQDLGIKLKLSGQMTEKGFALARGAAKLRGQTNLLSLFQKVKIGDTDFWVSPHKLKQLYNFWIQQVHVSEGAYRQSSIKAVAYYRQFMQRLPENIWSDPRLEQMFALRRNWGRDEVQGSMVRDGSQADEGQLMQSLGFPADKRVDNFTKAYRNNLQMSQIQRSSESGRPLQLSAPESLLSYESRSAWERFTRMGNDPKIDKELKNLAHEIDRIGMFTKKWWTIDQLIQRNPHIVRLRTYGENKEQMKQLHAQWLSRADDTARAWRDITDPTSRAAIAQVLFDLTEMNYRSAAEVQAKVVRLPADWQLFLQGQAPTPGGELDRLFKKSGLEAKHYAIIRRVQGDFMAFLDAVEAVRTGIIARAHGTTGQAYQTAIAALQKEMGELRQKPYFPMVRFGEFTLTVRDPQNHKVIWSNAYGTQSQRDAAVASVRQQFPLGDITVSRVSHKAHEFMGLPGPLIRGIKEKLLKDMPNLSPNDKIEVERSLEEFEMLNAPDRSFRRRWMPSKGIPGYSSDAFRAYSHYFMYGSRYLARLAYMDALQEDIAAVRGPLGLGQIGNAAKRQAIVDYMSDHYGYMMESGDDAGKFRAWVSLWFLGFSPAAAVMNLTQPFMTTWPKLTADFGLGKANRIFSLGINAAKAANGYTTGNAEFMAAKAELTAQGYIEQGQAAELGAFAEGTNLHNLLDGTTAQKTLRNLSYYGMKMFSAAEHWNRQLTFKLSYDLAYETPNAPAVLEVERQNPVQIADLVRRVQGLTYRGALATIYAKEIIKRTQFEFSRDSDPPFMRGKMRKNFLIFFKYTHSMLFALRFNGAMFQMFLILALLYGFQGLPGSDEFNEILRLLSRKLFGVDFDLHGKAREFVRDMTRGTVFDQTGPDLFMHGISRYGFGFGLLPEGWGGARFDASANGSMGRLIPGLAEFMHGINVDAKPKDLIADSAQRASGAGYGQLFAILNFMMSPTSTEQHKWEQLLPRFMRGWAAAYRYSPIGSSAEVDSSGARVVKFNPTDPDDLSAVVTQALGFKPTRVNETWEAIRDAREEIQVYNARKAMLYVQFNRALLEKNPEAVNSMITAIREFNDQVAKTDPSMQIKAEQLRASLKQRATARELKEQFLAASKKDILVTSRIMDMYPGVRVERVK